MTKEEIFIKPLRDKTLVEEFINYINIYGIKALMELLLKAIDDPRTKDEKVI